MRACVGRVSDRKAFAAYVSAIGAAVVAAIVQQSPAPPAIRVAIADGTDWTAWRPEHRAAIAAVLPALAATGDRWELAASADDADVVVRPYDSQGRCEHAGVYAPGSRDVRIDYACLHGLERLQYAVVHEALHWLTWRRARWVGHLCAHAGDAIDCHATVHGRGVLAPAMPWEVDGDSYAPPPRVALTADDVRLLDSMR